MTNLYGTRLASYDTSEAQCLSDCYSNITCVGVWYHSGTCDLCDAMETSGTTFPLLGSVNPVDKCYTKTVGEIS